MRELYRRIREHPEIRRRPGLAHFIKFSIVGTSNTIIDFGLFALFTRLLGWHFQAANVLSFTAAASWSYVANRRWTFRNTDPRIRTQYVKFLVVSVIGLVLTAALLHLFIDRLHIVDIVAKAMAVLIVLAWNFTANRLWTFRQAELAK